MNPDSPTSLRYGQEHPHVRRIIWNDIDIELMFGLLGTWNDFHSNRIKESNKIEQENNVTYCAIYESEFIRRFRRTNK